jgi:hypothetical protein
MNAAQFDEGRADAALLQHHVAVDRTLQSHVSISGCHEQQSNRNLLGPFHF